MRHRTHRPIKLPEASGFTLIELLVAVSLVGIVLTAGATLVYQVTQARARVDRLASHHAEADAAVRAISTALTRQFRNAGDNVVFVGEDEEFDRRPADRIRFFTTSHRVIRPGEPESDVHEVEFYLEAQAGEPYPALIRRTDPTRNELPDGGGVVEVVARRIAGLDFEYFDGERWSPDWPGFLNRSPSTLRITVAVADDEAARTARPYRRLIHLPMMPQPGSGGGSGGGTEDGGASVSPGGGFGTPSSGGGGL